MVFIRYSRGKLKNKLEICGVGISIFKKEKNNFSILYEVPTQNRVRFFQSKSIGFVKQRRVWLPHSQIKNVLYSLNYWMDYKTEQIFLEDHRSTIRIQAVEPSGRRCSCTPTSVRKMWCVIHHVPLSFLCIFMLFLVFSIQFKTLLYFINKKCPQERANQFF